MPINGELSRIWLPSSSFTVDAIAAAFSIVADGCFSRITTSASDGNAPSGTSSARTCGIAPRTTMQMIARRCLWVMTECPLFRVWGSLSDRLSRPPEERGSTRCFFLNRVEDVNTCAIGGQPPYNTPCQFRPAATVPTDETRRPHCRTEPSLVGSLVESEVSGNSTARR